MKKLLSTFVFLSLGLVVFSQETNLVRPENGQTSFILNPGQSDDLNASECITLNPGVHIRNGAIFSAVIGVAPLPQPSYTTPSAFTDENYIFTRVYQKAMDNFTASSALEADVHESITYFDGLGRGLQQQQLKASGGVKDLVTHMAYDDYGRMVQEFLPYEDPTTGFGQLRSGTEGKTGDYYYANYPQDLNTNNRNPFSEKVFEASPLNRVLQQGAPGEDWRIGGGHEIKFEYATNTAAEVKRFDVTTTLTDGVYVPAVSSPGNYAAGELTKTVTKDENWTSGNDHTTEEFTNKNGQVVLKRTYNTTTHDTYYIYDDFGNLTYVLSPKMNGSTANMTDLGYQYRYDLRNRLVEKKIPGKGWEYIVYNKLDQPVMTQDANLKNDGKWLYTKYDRHGRVAYTGFINSSDDRESHQTLVDAYTGDLWVSNGSTSIDGTSVGYTNTGYPNSSYGELHTINYYDGYNTTRDGIAKPTGSIYGQAVTDQVQGLATVSKVRVLGENDWITTLTAYDQKGRPIYTKSENSYLDTEDVVETELDFVGKPLKVKTTHTRGTNAPIVTVDLMEYDHQGRLKRQLQELGGNTELIALNEYDGIGQLVEKKVGNTTEDHLQKVDYEYNIRGWLTSINEPGNMRDDLYNQVIMYNAPDAGAEALYNGNISRIYWRTQNTDNSLKKYTYTYDALNRITEATDNTGKLDLSSVGYDKNGNIKDLKRDGWVVENPDLNINSNWGVMDDLTYSYFPNSNQLAKVADAAPTDQYGFKDDAVNTATDTSNDYTYDVNGNMTSDANKGITSIAYNHLNLPVQVSFSSGGVINYVYDAAGMKLEKTASNGAYTEYTGNHVYEGGTLQFFNTPEGYVDVDNGNYSYVYRFKDHLENIRLSYTDADGNGTIDPATEIIKETNYYPYGLSHRGYNGNISPLGNSVAKRFMFGGKEFQEELNLNWYDITARNYDPALGRWMNLDPLAEQMRRHSPYNYAFDNPIYFIDYDGMMPCPKGEDCSSRWGIFKMEFKETLKSMVNGLKSMNNDIKSALASVDAVNIEGDATSDWVSGDRKRTSEEDRITILVEDSAGDDSDTTDGGRHDFIDGDALKSAGNASKNANKMKFSTKSGPSNTGPSKTSMGRSVAESGRKNSGGFKKGSKAVDAVSTIMSGNANEPDTLTYMVEGFSTKDPEMRGFINEDPVGSKNANEAIKLMLSGDDIDSVTVKKKFE